MKLPPLNTLQAFEASGRLGNLSRAGQELHVTHAAVSSQIKRLEGWFGRQLFDRSAKGVSLTAAGHDLYDTVDTALNAIANTSERLKRIQTKAVSVACLPSIATRWLVPLLPEFTERHPDIKIKISYAEALARFDAEHCDVMVTHLPMPSERMTNVRLFSRINKPVASPSYIQRNSVLRQGAFDGVKLLHDEVTQAWDDWFAKAKQTPKSLQHGPVYQNFDMLATAVIAGHGVALCPVEVFRREIVAGDLVILSDIATLEDHGYYVVCPKAHSTAVATFIRWFIAACGQAE